MKRLIIFLTVLTLIILNSCKDKVDKSEIILATWDGGEINLAEFEEFAFDHVFDHDSSKVFETDINKKREIIREMIENDIILYLADSLRLDTLPEIRSKYDESFKYIAYFKHFLKDSIIDHIVTPKKMKETYEKMKYRYKTSHILLVSKGKDDRKVKTRIDSVYQAAVQQPNSFGSIAKKVSDDLRTGIHGGDLGWALSTKFLKDFEQNLTGLNKGDISKPFKTIHGWHIIKVSDKMLNRDLKSFPKEKNNVINAVLSQNYKIYENKLQKLEDYLYSIIEHKTDSTAVEEYAESLNIAVNLKKDKQAILKSMKYNIPFATVMKDTIRSEVLKASIEKINMDKKDEYEIKPEHIYNIITNHLKNLIIEKALVRLGYTNDNEVIEEVKFSLYDDYLSAVREYFEETDTDKLLNKIYHSNNVKIDYTVLETAFYFVKDNKK